MDLLRYLVIMVSLASLNCNGLRNHEKRNELFTYLKKNRYDIVLLQETFWDDSIEKIAMREWDGEIISSNCLDINRRGVTILIRKNSDIDIESQRTFINGRLLQINVIVDEQRITIFNIYAPCNISEKKCFFNDFNQKISGCTNHIIIAGDFNTVLNTYLDKYPPNPSGDASRKSLKDIMISHDLTDIWRDRNEQKIQFTRYRNAINGRVASRIDRFLISKTLTPNVKNCGMENYPKSDHDIIHITLDLAHIPRGKGVWIFNNTLLDDQLFCTAMKNFIEEYKTEYDYDNNFCKWYDEFKIRIKRISINFSKQKQRRLRKTKRSLEKQINYENYKAQKFIDYDVTRLKGLENQLDDILVSELRGAALRAKIQWFEESEKSTKFFLNLEKGRQKKKVMKQLIKEDGTLIHDQNGIIREQVEFYTNLYTSTPTDKGAKTIILDSISRTLSYEHMRFCDSDLTTKEIYEALKSMKTNKSPGLDGLTSEFYKVFWEELEDIVLKLTSDIYTNGELTNSMKTGMITLIPKQGDLRNLTNWRPISLLNTDYKIITKALANKLSKVISTLISEDQTCCVPGRNIADNVILMDNIIQYLNNNGRNGYLLKIDQYKAFDRVEHDYLLDILDKMGFGINFRKWIKILYTDIRACIKHNGYISQHFSIQRGVRQGCPISAILYVLSAEPFHEIIVNCDRISGIRFIDNEVKIFQHADDTTFFLDNASSIENVFEVINIYEKASGSKCNTHKTELLVIGPAHIETKYNFNFPVRHDYVKILGIFLGNDRKRTDHENWDAKTKVCTNILNRWKHRKLSFKGKAVVINSLMISRLVYSATILPVPTRVINAVRESIVTFIWRDKKPAIAYNVLSLPTEKGGLNICDLSIKRDSLRIRYISRLISNQLNHKLKCIMLYNLNHYENMKLGLDIFRIIPENKSLRGLPMFYGEILIAWNKIAKDTLIPPNDREEILNQPLFHNPFITDESNKVFYNKEFIEGDIVYISDLMYEMIPNHIPSKAIYETIIATNPNAMITLSSTSDYIDQLLKSIPNHWLKEIYSSDEIVSIKSESNLLLRLKCENSWLDASNMTSKQASMLLRNIVTKTPKGESHWKATYDIVDFKNRWSCVYGGIKVNQDADLDFKILHNIVFTNDKLHKFGMIDSPLCTLCKSEIETINHLFIYCPRIHFLWKQVVAKLENVFIVDSWDKATLLGVNLPKKRNERILIDFILNIYKNVIWTIRISILNCDNSQYNINIQKFFHNTVRKKIRLLFLHFEKNDKCFRFWELFDQCEMPTILAYDTENNYKLYI